MEDNNFLMYRINIEYLSKGHIQALDCVRGLAVLMIMLFHCFNFVIFKFGWIGVDLFFVLSGFLITGILLDTKFTPNYYRNFIVRRIVRIFPLYYFVLILCLILLPLTFPKLLGPEFDYYLNHQAWFWTYTQNWLYSKTGFPENQTLVHLWSLAVEEQFYIFWPLVVKIFNTRRLFIVCLIIVVFSLIFRFYIGAKLGLIHPFQYMATLSRMDALIIGAIIAILIRKRKIWLEKYTIPVFVVCLLVLIGTMLYLRAILFLRLAPMYTIIDILSGCLLIFMLNRKKIFVLRPLYHPVFIFLGKYSYGLYIYHFILFNVFENSVLPGLVTIIESEKIASLAGGAVVFIVSFPISVLSYKYLEQPFLKLKKFFPNT
ncbi:MAG TPA: acyltransferase [Candidatus Dojkabacteria bacterium]|nr:acyltransferase [Candidatus Dojkabacteria bacterium]